MNTNNNAIKLFEGKKVRSVWDEDKEEWYFSVLDIVSILTEQPDYTKTRNYWKWLKNKLTEEGSQLVSNTNQLKLPATDGKNYLTDVMDTEQILRLIQSIPSKKAEPFKLWLAQVGKEVIDESQDPEKAIDRAINNYRRLGYSESWINQRIKTIEVRKALTDEWDKSGVRRGREYAELTDLMYQTWADMTAKEYKRHKGLKKENLRDNMTNTELVLNMLAEVTTTEIHQSENPKGLRGSKTAAKRGAGAAKVARNYIEQETGKSVISTKRHIATKSQPKRLK